MDFKQEIVSMVNEIENQDILEYIYILVLDISKEEKRNTKE